jgi:hypothetical protein
VVGAPVSDQAASVVAPLDPMGISDQLPASTRTVYDPPLWSRFATANDESPWLS